MIRRCVVFGAGSIGKAVAGYTCQEAGWEFRFIECSTPIIDDWKERGEYRIFRSAGSNRIDRCRPLDMLHVSRHEAITEALMGADLVMTAVGQEGLGSVGSLLDRMIRSGQSLKRRLPVLLCENMDAGTASCAMNLPGDLPEASLPVLLQAAVETMARPSDLSPMDILAEPHSPLLVMSSPMTDPVFRSFPVLFRAVPNFTAYYYRKLYLNNLGHFVLGMEGTIRGLRTTIEAMGNPQVLSILCHVLKESMEGLRSEYRLSVTDLDLHLEQLLARYSDREMCDPLSRLVRDPIRKLRRKERLLGPISLCMQHSLPHDHLLSFFIRTMRTLYPQLTNDPISFPEILEECCDLHPEEDLYREACIAWEPASKSMSCQEGSQ